MREIPPLRTLALRAVGSPTCDPEVTFGGAVARRRRRAPDGENGKNGNKPRAGAKSAADPPSDEDSPPDRPDEPTAASCLLRSLRKRPVLSTEGAAATTSGSGTGSSAGDDPARTALEAVPLPRRPYAGLARPNANDVDLSHPWILAAHPPRRNGGGGACETLLVEHGNHATDTLQMFVDALVESGRAGDSRLGVHFFREWVAAVAGEHSDNGGQRIPLKKRRKKQRDLQRERDRERDRDQHREVDDGSSSQRETALGSLSMHNLSLASTKTFRSMAEAGVGRHLSVLDLTGVHGVTDVILQTTLCSGSFFRLRRLSLKNCRKVTGVGVSSLEKLTDLRALDLGGCFNVLPADVVSLVERHPGTKRGTFGEIYASGLGWTDLTLESLLDASHAHLRGLGVGFSHHLSGSGLVLALSRASDTLELLAVPFCDGPDDAAIAALGKALPRLACLDIRGCHKISSLTGLMDGRVSMGLSAGVFGKSNGGAHGGNAHGSGGHLFVLARYSNITKNSLEDTLAAHQHSDGICLTCVLDGGGTGEGIRR